MAKLILAAFLLCLSLDSVRAEDLSPLASINLRIEEETKNLDNLSSAQKEIDSKLLKLKEQIRDLTTHDDALKIKLAETLEQRAKVKAELDHSTSEIDRISALSIQRLRTMYMLHTEVPHVSLVSAAQTDLTRSYYFLGKIKAFDQKLIEKLATLKKDRAEEELRLGKVTDAQRKLQVDLNKQALALKLRADEQKALSASLSAQREKVEQSLSELRAQALRLETVVVSLTTDQGGSQEPQKKERETAEPEQGGHFEGAGLFTYKGSLLPPVHGDLVKGFGKHRVEKFSDIVFNKGIEFKTTAGEEVRAIAPGKVIFAGRLPGYDTIIIIDHGKRSHSLYGKLGEVSIKKGQIVERGDLLAKTGVSSEQLNFYFEIRVNGAPVDPVKYYKKGVFDS